jgi:uncharacterized protein
MLAYPGGQPDRSTICPEEWMTDATLPPVIASLLRSDAYPHEADDVELVQTHVSYVLLAGEFVYKLKKPLDLGFLDYSTLDRRKLMCEEEVRLNRRLCDDVYLGVVPIVRDDGAYRVSGDGEPVEYAVQMQRLPQERMMPALIERGEVGAADIRRLAQRLAEFHRTSETDDRIAAFGRMPGVKQNWDENFDQTEPYIGRTISREQFEAIRSYVDGFMRSRRSLIERRADEGRTRDCHGDLRSDAVVIREDGTVCVMDCIEFNDRIRYGDVASDLAFLVMDLEFRGHQRLADAVAGAYIGEAADETLPAVLNFYKCYRAYVRGKVDGFQLDDEAIPASQRKRAQAQASAYFRLAERYARTSYPPMLLAMVGLSGSGKSHVAQGLAARTGFAIVSSDVVRREALGVGRNERMWEPYDSGAYTSESRSAVYRAMHERASSHLAEGRGLILDATYIRSDDRAAARQLAANSRVPFVAVHVTADERTTREHLAARLEQESATSDARWEIYLAQREAFEPPDEIPAAALVTLDGALPLTQNVEAALAHLSA